MADINTVAIIGLSAAPERVSYRAAEYLRQQGITVIPVNPSLSSWHGLTAYPDLSSVPADVMIDTVCIYRHPDQVEAHVAEAVARPGVRTIILPEGVVHDGARQLAERHGKRIYMNLCIMKSSP